MTTPTETERAKARALLDKIAKLPDDLAVMPTMIVLRERQAEDVAKALASARVEALESAEEAIASVDSTAAPQIIAALAAIRKLKGKR